MGSENKTDVVYVLGKGSSWNDNELRFSLRSLEKNLIGYRRIYIIGEKPSWIKNIIHIPHPDEFPSGKNNDGNIIKKVLRACQVKNLSSDFLFINDDHFIMRPVHILDIPPYQKGDMTTFEQQYFDANFWRGRLWRTKNVLIKKGYSAYHYDCHTPILFNKKKFPEVISQFDYENNIGFTMKSLYGNVVYGKGVPMKGHKKTIFRNYTYPDIVERLKKCRFATVNDEGLNIDIKMYLYNTFREQSKYEAEGLSGQMAEIFDWFQDGKDYVKGCELYNRYGKNVNIMRFLSTRSQRSAQKKLEQHLLKLLYK